MKVIDALKGIKNIDLDKIGPDDPQQKEEFKKLFWESAIVGLKLFIKYGAKAL
jgi:hypothetical protein